MSSLKICCAVFILSGTGFGGSFSLSAEEPVCHHCEDIREYNAKYHENFEYYGDYLKTKDGKTTAGNEAKKTIRVDSGQSSTDSSGVKTIPSSTTSPASTGVSAPPTPPANQAPKRS